MGASTRAKKKDRPKFTIAVEKIATEAKIAAQYWRRIAEDSSSDKNFFDCHPFHRIIQIHAPTTAKCRSKNTI